MPKREARPRLAGGGRAARTETARSGRRNCSMVRGPVALEIIKNGRTITPYKLVPMGGELVLAQVVRSQRGTDQALSVPMIVLDFGEKMGVEHFYWRQDKQMVMRRIPPSEIRRKGRLQENHEVYFPFSFMEQVPWKAWPFATRAIKLGPTVPYHDSR
jgi:hypothetical protein